MSWPEVSGRVRDSSFRHFAEPVTYTPSGGDPEAVQGIFGERPIEVDRLDMVQGAVLSTELVLELRQADLAAGVVAADAEVEVRGVTYQIRRREPPDDTGVVACMLRRGSA